MLNQDVCLILAPGGTGERGRVFYRAYLPNCLELRETRARLLAADGEFHATPAKGNVTPGKGRATRMNTAFECPRNPRSKARIKFHTLHRHLATGLSDTTSRIRAECAF